MAAIASLSLNLVADLKGWSGNLKKASDGATAFGSTVKAAADQAGKSLGSFANSGFGSFAKGAAQAAAGLAIFNTAKAGLSAAFDASVGSVVAGMDRIDQLADKSAQLGVATDALSGLRHAANLTGSSAEDLDGALEKLNANLGDAAQKGTPAGDALARIGLDAKQLASVPADVAFKKIVGGFEQVPNAADKASLAMDIFGKGGVKILNTLGAGAGEIGRLSDEAAKLGISVSQVDAAKIGAAKDGLDRAGAAIQGLGNMVAVELAPVIEVAAVAFTDFLGSTVEGAGGVETAIGGVVDVLGWVGDAAAVSGRFVADTFAGIVGAAGSALSAIGLEAGKSLAETSRSMKAGIADTFATLPSEKIGKFLDDVKQKSDAAASSAARLATENMGAAAGGFDGIGKSVAELTAKLKEQADTIGMTAAQADIYKLKMAGATESELANAQAQAERIKAAEQGQKDQASAKSYFDGTRTAAEKLEAELGKIADLKAKGLIDDDTAGRAATKAAEGSGAAAGDRSAPKLAGAATLGSTEGYSAIVAALSGRGTGANKVEQNTKATADAIKQLVSVANKQLAAASKPVQQPVNI